MPVDSFKFLPRIIAAFYQSTELQRELPIPWIPVPRPLNDCTFGLVTSMPFWAEKIGVPRTLAVEFPFGHSLGLPGEIAQQTRVISEALEVLETAETPGDIFHSEET